MPGTTLGLLRHSYRDNTLGTGTFGDVASAVVEAAAATARASVRTARARSPRATNQPYSMGFSKGSSPTDSIIARSKDDSEPMQLIVPDRLRRNSIKNFGVSVREYKRRVYRKQQKHSQAISRKKMELAYKKWLATQDNMEMTPFQKCHHELKKCTQQIAKKLSDESERRFPKGFFEGSSETQESLPGDSSAYWRDQLLVQDDQVVKFVAAVAKENERASRKKKQHSPELEQFPHPVYLT